MAIVFAVTLGWCGVHRFTLGQWQLGLVHIFLFVVSMAAFEGTFLAATPWMTLSALLGYATALWWWRMGSEEFADRYLELADEDAATEVKGKYLNGTARPNPRVVSRRQRRRVLAEAAQLYEGFDYAAAAARYEEALDMDLADGDSRVLAARCYSLLEDDAAAYRNLRRAVQLKAGNLALVERDASFAWLRTRPDFERRKRAGYAAVGADADGDAPAALPPPGDNVLDRLEQLGRLRERGLLDDDEFTREKRRLLR